MISPNMTDQMNAEGENGIHLDRITSVQKLHLNDKDNQGIEEDLETTQKTTQNIQYNRPGIYAQSQMKQLSQTDLNNESQQSQERCLISAGNTTRIQNKKITNPISDELKGSNVEGPISQDQRSEIGSEEESDMSEFEDTGKVIRRNTDSQPYQPKTQQISHLVSPMGCPSIDYEQNRLEVINEGPQYQSFKNKGIKAIGGRSNQKVNESPLSRKRNNQNNQSQTSISVIPRSQINFETAMKKPGQAGPEDYTHNLNLIMQSTNP